MNKVVVGLSGGVDSSVAALLLKRAGFEVLAVYLKCYWTYEGCQSDQDRASAAKVASFLDIPFEVWDFEKEYRRLVVEYFYSEYQKGRTPNPDVVCNREIKFGLFVNKALEGSVHLDGTCQDLVPSDGIVPTVIGTAGARAGHPPVLPPVLSNSNDLVNTIYIATGHYARIGIRAQSSEFRDQSREEKWILPKFCQEDAIADSKSVKTVDIREFVDLSYKKGSEKGVTAGINGKFAILGGEDTKKDQSYFLYDIDKDVIEHILFPLGNLTKSKVRLMAKEAGLPTADRPDSSGICFIGEVNIEKFLKERINEHEGDVVDINGDIIGRHKGVEFYTIGQRHGFDVVDSRVGISPAAIASRIKTRAALSLAHAADYRVNSSTTSRYSGPWYVVGKDIQNNRLVVGMGEECKRSKFKVQSSKSLAEELKTHNSQLFVRIRHLGEMIPCRVTWDVERSTLNVELAYPVFGVAPGQSAVFYRAIGGRSVGNGYGGSALGSSLWRVAGGGVISA